ncbi:MAG: alpha/beta fold hydrolase, partial [bacterium]|nr:alpha/beta fold hydrolase [bacterium]
MNWQRKPFLAMGVRTFYFDIGSGEPVIFFSGGGAGALTYRRHLELLSKKYRVFAPDLPCFGDADAPKTPWGFDDYGEYFKIFIESLSLDKLAVIGHSFGGGVALAVAARTPKVTRLILANCAGLAPRYSFFGFLLRICRGVVKDF